MWFTLEGDEPITNVDVTIAGVPASVTDITSGGRYIEYTATLPIAASSGIDFRADGFAGSQIDFSIDVTDLAGNAGSTLTTVTDNPPSEVDIAWCITNPCMNDGTCFELSDSFHCLCAYGWDGEICEEDFDECASEPCLNGGQCSHGFGDDSFECECTAAWEGPVCQYTTLTPDCLGVLGGDATFDQCGVCGGRDDCIDCAGVIDGESEHDNCGVCDDDKDNDCVPDCSGVWGGENEVDDCGICGGDNECNRCPERMTDRCGVCDMNPENDCQQDCRGNWGGTVQMDLCGVCGGRDRCVDCAGTPNGRATTDRCGVCDDRRENDCRADCAGIFGGRTEVDECDVCDGDGTSCTQSFTQLDINVGELPALPTGQALIDLQCGIATMLGPVWMAENCAQCLPEGGEGCNLELSLPEPEEITVGRGGRGGRGRRLGSDAVEYTVFAEVQSADADVGHVRCTCDGGCKCTQKPALSEKVLRENYHL